MTRELVGVALGVTAVMGGVWAVSRATGRRGPTVGAPVTDGGSEAAGQSAEDDDGGREWVHVLGPSGESIEVHRGELEAHRTCFERDASCSGRCPVRNARYYGVSVDAGPPVERFDT